MKPYVSFLKKWTVFAVTAAFLFSCQKQNSDYLQSIPADADMVVTLYPQKLIEKGNMAALLKNPSIQESLQPILESVPAESREVLEEVFSDPQQAGLSLQDDLILFFELSKNSFGLVLKIEDRGKFETAFSTLFSSSKFQPEIVHTGDGYCLKIKDNAVCTFNDNKAVILCENQYTPTDLKEQAFLLLNQKREQSLLTNETFARFLPSTKEISVWISLSAYAHHSVYASILPEGLDLKEVSVGYYIDFQPGKIVIDTQTLGGNADTQKALEHFASFIEGSSNALLEYFPENAWGIFSVALNGEKLFDILTENPYFALMNDNVSGEIDLQKLIGSIDGNITVGITGISENPSFGMLPNLTLLAKVKDESLLDFLKQNLRLLNVTALTDNRYKVTWDRTDIYFGLQDKHILYISTEAAPQKAAAPFSKTPLAKIFKSESAGAINMEPLLQHLPKILPASEYAKSEPWLSMISSVEAQSEKQSGKITFYLNDDSENALAIFRKIFESQIQP